MTVLGTTLIIFYLHYELEALNIIKKHKPKEEHLDHHDHHEEKRKHLSLQAEGDHFMIDDKKFNIYSGELHYFRVHPEVILSYFLGNLIKYLFVIFTVCVEYKHP